MRALARPALVTSLVVALLASAALAGACTPDSGAPPPLRAASADRAREVVRAFLDACVARDAARVAEHMCGARDEAPDRAKGALAGPLAIESYELARVEPAWVGAEPYFRVDVTLQRDAGRDERSLSVRAREGCVDRLLGEPVQGAKPPDPTEIEL